MKRTSNDVIRQQLKEVKTFNRDNWYMVITIKPDVSNEELLRFLRSRVPEIFLDRSLHQKFKYQLQEIIKTIYEYSRVLEPTEPWCILISFSEAILERSKKAEVSEALKIKIIPVEKVQENNCTLAHVPDFTFALTEKTSFADKTTEKIKKFTVSFTPEQALINVGETSSSDSAIETIKNPYIKPPHNRYNEKVGVTGSKSIYHGNASEKHLRTEVSGWILFIREALAEFDRKYPSDNVLVLFSQSFIPIKDQLKKVVQTELHVKNIKLQYSSSDLFDSASRDVDHTDTITGSSEQSSDPHDIVRALRNGRIKELVMSSSFSLPGYVTPDGDCYTYPVKDSKKVANIRPWLIKQAAETSANVAISDEQKDLISAVPRY